MASKHVISMSLILGFFKDHAKQMERGENGYSSGHVVEFRFNCEVFPALLTGKVEASMKNKKYDVNISVDLNQGTITDAKCSCPRGQVACHHMAALCIYAYHNVSSTDTGCTWNVPSTSSRNTSIQTLSDIFPFSKPDYQPVGRLATDDEVSKFKEDLAGKAVGFSWLLQPEPSREAFLIPQIEDILASVEFLNAANRTDYFMEICSIGEQTVKAVLIATKGQAANPNWLMARKYRLTASKFAFVLRACRRGTFSNSFYQNLLEGYNLGGIKAIQWGVQHEKTGLETFVLATGMSVEQTGLWLHPCGFLGASPDGVVGNNLVEVKCPFKYRSVMLSEVLKRDKSYIIYKNESSETVLNKTHDYYHQIQGQLYLSGKTSCYLVVWTPEETEIVQIEKDPEWAINIDILKSFYVDRFIPYLLGNKEKGPYLIVLFNNKKRFLSNQFTIIIVNES